MTMNIEQARFELMARAPAVPDWFRPNVSDLGDPNEDLIEVIENPPGIFHTRDIGKRYLTEEYRLEYQKRKVLQWPSYYADEVLKRGANAP